MNIRQNFVNLQKIYCNFIEKREKYNEQSKKCKYNEN